MVKFLRAQFFFVCVCKFLKIFMVSDKTIHKAFWIHKSLSFIKTKPIRNIKKKSTIYQNYTLALMKICILLLHEPFEPLKSVAV